MPKRIKQKSENSSLNSGQNTETISSQESQPEKSVILSSSDIKIDVACQEIINERVMPEFRIIPLPNKRPHD